MVESESTIALDVLESSSPGNVRRLAVQLASRLGFDETEQGRVAIVATELANNLVRHATGGEILLQSAVRGARRVLEIVALDRGPGMESVERSLEDGYSTGGTAGTGLGAIKRISSYFDIHTAMGVGSAAVACLQRKSHDSCPPFDFAIGAISACHPAETICGDAWAACEQDHDLMIIVADGLGHGPLAATAARAAIQIFEEFCGEPPEEIVNRANDALRSTRGAAVAIAKIDSQAQEVIYAGMGNIAATIHRQGTMKSLVSSNGTVGASTRKAQRFTYPWSADSTLVMVSDGLSSHLRMDRHPGLLRRDPTMIAGVLYRDFKRGKDDATVVVARQAEVADR